MKKSRWIFAVAVLTGGMGLLWAGPAALLDGKTYELRITDQKTVNREHVYFLKGQFESMECRQYGFKKAPYTARTTAEGVSFKVVAPSPTEGTNTWTGVVVGTTVAGQLLWEKEGQNPIVYPFEGGLSPLSQWPADLQKALHGNPAKKK